MKTGRVLKQNTCVYENTLNEYLFAVGVTMDDTHVFYPPGMCSRNVYCKKEELIFSNDFIVVYTKKGLDKYKMFNCHGEWCDNCVVDTNKKEINNSNN